MRSVAVIARANENGRRLLMNTTGMLGNSPDACATQVTHALASTTTQPVGPCANNNVNPRA